MFAFLRADECNGDVSVVESDSPRVYAAVVMKRPKGVTVMAYIFLVMAFTVVRGLVVDTSYLLRGGWLLLSVPNLLIPLVLGIALLKMKSWARWLCIGIGVASIPFLLLQIIAAHPQSPLFVRAVLFMVFYIWAIWYLSQPHVKAAFKNSAIAQATLVAADQQTPSA